MTASPSLTPAPAKESKRLGRRFLAWLLGAFVVLVLLFAVAVLNNNYSMHQRSRAEFTAQFDRAIESSTQSIVQHPENYGNPPLMFMVGDMAEMSGDPRLQ